MGDNRYIDTPAEQRTLAQSSVALAIVRDQALQQFLNDKNGQEINLTTTGRRTESGLQLDTVNDKTRAASTMIMDGTTGLARHDFGTNLTLSGDFNITHVKAGGNTTEKGQFRMTQGLLDSIYGEGYKKNATIVRMDTDGKPFQTFKAAHSEALVVAGKTQYDPNDQPVRVARLAGSDANCSKDNPGNPGNKRSTCSYIVDIPKFGDLSLNQTSETLPAGIYHKSVIRDMQGKVLAIADQKVNVDGNGDVTSIETQVRAPRKPRGQ